MVKVLLSFCFIVVCASAAFADRMVSDPSTANIGMSFEVWQAAKGLTDVQVVATGKLITSKAYEPDGSVSYILDSLVPGSFSWYIRTFGLAYVYGPDNTPGGSTLYSVFVPFSFTKRSAAAGSIPGLRLAP